MDFRGSPKPPPYFNRRDQIRLLLMSLAFVLVLVAARRMADPAVYGWMFPNGEAERAAVVDAEQASTELDDDGLVSTAEAEDFRDELSLDWLDGIRDDTTGVLSTEFDAHYGLLSRAKAADTDAFEAAAEERPSRSVLMQNPGHFRGRLVTVEGELLRLLPFDVPEPMRSEYGLARLWDAWVAMPDAPKRPLHIVLATVPKSLPVASGIEAPPRVRVTGWFFKREAVLVDGEKEGDVDVTRTPLLLGKTAVLVPEPKVVVGDTEALTRYLIGFAVVIAVVLAIGLFWFSRSDKKFGDAHIRHFTEAPEGAIAALDELDYVDPNESMRRLADEAAGESQEADEEPAATSAAVEGERNDLGQ